MFCHILSILTSFLILIPIPLYAQVVDFQSGARSMGLGNASVATSDVWSTFNNIGALADAKDYEFAFSYLSLFQLEGFNAAAACFNAPFRHFNAGFGVYYFGDRVYNESKLNLGFSHKINFVSLGVSVNYLRYNVVEFSSAGAWVMEAGGRVELFPSLYFGASIFNMNQAKIGGAKAPVLMKTGFSYHSSEKFMFNVEVEKEPERKAVLKSGIEFEVVKELVLRTGAAIFPSRAYFGIGFKPKIAEIDYAFSQQHRLGMTHQVSANFKLRERY